ncbi:hypothetical protein PG637_10780 [Riemerella anatipestifer]|nr:hypothetical protein [Riemerella anatipestifer]MDY3326151.1 hypothetical protein [Riemerella anatipestifer]MDY3354501.1 hypothetical protein [Riemerella anatipestifer]
MIRKNPIPCPECDREKYFEGLCYACNNRKQRAHYELMSKDQIETAIKKIIEKIETIDDWEDVYIDFNGLLAYQDIDTEEIATVAFEKDIFYPPTLYRNATEEIQNKLIELILQSDCKEANHILCCLAVIGSEKVREIFYELEQNPLPWQKNLRVNPSFYAELGGWTFDDNGKRIELNYKECYSITNEEREDNAIKIGEAKSENCTVCKCQTVNILTLNGNDERLSFLGLNGTIKIPICPNCASMCEKTIVRYQLDGESSFEIVEPFVEENYVLEEDFKKLTTNNLRLSQTPKPVYFSCGNDDVSTIGGNPEWVQDWQYESCPDCQKKMKLLSAISWDQVLDGSEGTLYIEICTDCSIVVTFHQQT